MTFTTLTLAGGAALEIAVLARVMLRPHREPAARIAWLAVVLALPLIGVLAYIVPERKLPILKKAPSRKPESLLFGGFLMTSFVALGLVGLYPDRF